MFFSFHFANFVSYACWCCSSTDFLIVRSSSWSEDEDVHSDNASNSLKSSSSAMTLNRFNMKGDIVNANEPATSVSTNRRASTYRNQPDIANTVMDRRLFYETNLQTTIDKPIIKSTKSTPNLNRLCATAAATASANSDAWANENGRLMTNGAAPMTKHDKYCRNIVSTTKIHFENTKALHGSNELNYRVQKTTPIKSVKLLNNLNVLKSRKYPETIKFGDE